MPDFRKGAKIRCSDWEKGEYIYLCKNGVAYDEKDNYFSSTYALLSSDSWEFYKEPEPDWDYIIKNKCLCWFWDDDDGEKMKIAGILAYYDYDNNQFKRRIGDKCAISWFDHCRPVRRDEVTFYEERKDVAED